MRHAAMLPRSVVGRLAALALVGATAVGLSGCDLLDRGFTDASGKPWTETPEVTPTAVDATKIAGGPQTRGAVCRKPKAGQKDADGNKITKEQVAAWVAPSQCETVPAGEARFTVVDSATGTRYGSEDYVPVDQFSASCLEETLTLKGPDGLQAVITKGSRSVALSRQGTEPFTYSDENLRWGKGMKLYINGTTELKNGSVNISVTVICPSTLKTPTPEATAEAG